MSESREKTEKTEKKETKGPPAHWPHPHPNHRLLEAVVYDQSIIAPDRGAADRLLGPSFRVIF
jgi:hypothetical protein